MRKFLSNLRFFFIVIFASLKINLFKKIKKLFVTIFLEDYKSLLFFIFIAISLLYKYAYIVQNREYYINARVTDVAENGKITIDVGYFKETIEIAGLNLPNSVDKCGSDFKIYIQEALENRIKDNKYAIDIKIVNSNPFFKKGIFYIQNQDIREYLEEMVFFKKIIPKEKQRDFCYILDKSGFSKRSYFLLRVNNFKQIISNFYLKFKIFKFSNYF